MCQQLYGDRQWRTSDLGSTYVSSSNIPALVITRQISVTTAQRSSEARKRPARAVERSRKHSSRTFRGSKKHSKEHWWCCCNVYLFIYLFKITSSITWPRRAGQESNTHSGWAIRMHEWLWLPCPSNCISPSRRRRQSGTILHLTKRNLVLTWPHNNYIVAAQQIYKLKREFMCFVCSAFYRHFHVLLLSSVAIDTQRKQKCLLPATAQIK